MQLLVDQAAVQALKDSMEYATAVTRCDTCEHFVDAHSGIGTVFPAHCELNPAAFFPVEKDSRCRFHGTKPPCKEVVETRAKGFHE